MAGKAKSDGGRSRQRNLLALLLQRSTSGDRQGLTLEQIVEQLLEDREYSDGTVQRFPAYNAASVQAYRQMFFRDCGDLAANGVEVIERAGRYTIDPTHVWVPGLGLSADESQLLLELRSSIGRPFGPNGLLQSTPMKRATGSRFGAKAAAFGLAKQQKRAVNFDFAKPGFWRRKGTEARTFVPLRFVISGNRRYVVGYDVDRNDIRGFLMDRVMSVPKFVSKDPAEVFELGTALVDQAKAWTPQSYQDATEVSFTTSDSFARYVASLSGDAVVATTASAKSTEVTMSFENEDAAIAFFVTNAQNVSAITSRKFASTLKGWLKVVNPKVNLDASKIKLSSDFDVYDNALLQTLSMISAILNSSGLYASELAEQFSVPIEFVTENVTKAIMARDPLVDTSYLVPVEFGDLDDEANPMYVPMIGSSHDAFGGDSPLTWSEVLDVQIMLAQMVSLGLDTSVSDTCAALSAKIHDATDVGVTVYTPASRFLDVINDALGSRVLELSYQSDGLAEPTTRRIVPTEIQLVLGERYVRALDLSTPAHEYRTYNVSRIWGVQPAEHYGEAIPTDSAASWLDAMLEDSKKVLVAVQERALPHWENLPRAAIAPEVTDGVHVIQVLIASDAFLDRRLAISGSFASVLDDGSPRAGVKFAAQIADDLKL